MPPAKRTLLFLAGASAVTVAFLFTFETMLSSAPNFAVPLTDYNFSAEDPPVDPEQTCQIPRIHPFDSSILSYLQNTKPIRCKIRQQPLTYVNSSGFLVFNRTLVRSTFPSCDYRNIQRRNGDDDSVYYSDPKTLPPEGVQIDSDFVTVSCYNFAGIAYYTDYHAHIGVRYKTKKRGVRYAKDVYSVLLIGIDSLSRLAFIRQLPKTYSYLTKTMNSYVFRGMTKVGDNTYPNLVALFTGKNPFGNDLPKVDKYDDWPLIWKNFSEEGYRTMYAEDRPDIALFNYLRNGFNRQPADHYMRPYWLAVEKSNSHRLSSHLCFGPVPKHLLQLRYAHQFARKLSTTRDPYFGFAFFVELSHDYVSQVSVADDDFTWWLNDLYSGGYLNRTVLVFFSDHGHRFDTIRETLVGRIEERMPFSAMYVPPSLAESSPRVSENLKINTGRLTSPYDVHATLVDILQYKKGVSPLGSVKTKYGVTLFGPISPKRTCSQAEITEHYCTCEVESPLPLEDQRCVYSSNLVVDTLNKMILEAYQNYSLCKKLSLMKLRRCDQSLPNNKVISNSRVYFGRVVEDGQAKGISLKLRVVVEVEPSGGLFEASLTYDQDTGIYYVTSDISRINRYGNQSSCIADAVLRKYCYCG